MSLTLVMNVILSKLPGRRATRRSIRRVESVFWPRRHHRNRPCGFVDRSSQKFGDIDHPQIDDLLDDLAELVLNKGGEVVVLPAERMPIGTEQRRFTDTRHVPR